MGHAATIAELIGEPSLLRAIGTGGYLLVLIPLLPFGAHRLWLLWLRFTRRPRREADRWAGPLPPVTVQLPVYDEANVVERLIDAACRLDYPRDRLEVQVLDDSDDETSELAARRVRRWRARGVDVRHVRRKSREGYKAGALAEGARRAAGEFLLVLDADFVPPPELIRQLLPPFSDPSVGCVQAAWSHLNEEESWLTGAQALLLDAHFAVEHEARHRAGLFLNFNGTAGMWRRSALEEAGGWEADTLTEDLDLSYRAQLAGWRCVYRDDVRAPGELPGTLRALEVQQERWAEGGIQTALKHLAGVWRSGKRAAVKLEATMHLLGHVVHPLTLLLGVALGFLGSLGGVPALLPEWVHALGLGLAFLPFVLFYGTAALLRGRSLRWAAPTIIRAMVLGVGLGVPLTGAVVRGLAGRGGRVFRRTPKAGAAPRRAYGVSLRGAAAALRLGLGLFLGAAILRLAAGGLIGATPFVGLFAAGYLLTAGESLRPASARVPGRATSPGRRGGTGRGSR